MNDKIKNLGVVYGRLSDFSFKETKKNKIKYMRISLDCPSLDFGNVKVYGRIFGEGRYNALLQELKQASTGGQFKGTSLKLEGTFTQYDGEESKILNTFTFNRWMILPSQVYRAAFSLVGRINGAVREKDEGHVKLLVKRTDGHKKEISESFDLYTEDPDMIEAFQCPAGALRNIETRIAGILKEKGQEDFFGRSSGIFKAYIKEIEDLET
jgi:hypothetical protein